MSEIHHNGNHHPADHHHGHPTETPDVSHIRNVDVTHELSDVSVEGVLKFIVGLTIMTAVTLGLMWALFKVLNSEAAKKDVQAPPGPMARTEEERRPPEPRLQEAPGFGLKLETGQLVPLDSKHAPGQPQAEYRVLQEQWEETLEKGKTDPTGKLVALPIGEAMKKLLEGESLP
ncbi:MAG: hypothetical protein ACRD6N_06850, partial [Pyrinomonadaceae bacterium]